MGTPKQKNFLALGISNILTFAFVIPNFYFLAGLFIGQRHFIFFRSTESWGKVWFMLTQLQNHGGPYHSGRFGIYIIMTSSGGIIGVWIVTREAFCVMLGL